MVKRILIVGAGGNQVPIIQKAKSLGFFTVAVDGDAAAPGLSVSDAAAAADICDAGALAQVARKYAVDGIYAAAEWGVEAASEAASRLGLAGTRPEAAHRLRSKKALREALDDAGLPNPSYASAATLTQAERAVQDIGLPVIVKPVDGNASRGVMRIDHFEDLSLAFRTALEASRCNLVMVEAFMEGEEYNVDGLMYDGRYILGGITGKERSSAPYRFDWGIYMPPRLSAEDETDIAEAVQRALDAVGLRFGTTHAEVMLTAQGPRIVEVAGRPGGGRIPTDLIPLTYGMDFMADALRVCMGEPPQEQRRWVRGSAVYWIPTHSGVVADIQGVDEARALRSVREVVLSVKVGDTLRHVVDCATRDKVGYILTVADDVEEAVRIAKEARDRIQIITTNLC